MLNVVKYIVFFALLSVSVKVFAQNLVLNPDMENYTVCPSGLSQVNNCNNWQEIANHFGTPDYFNSCAVGNVNVPANNSGWQMANSGVGYCGLLLMTQEWAEYREYLTTTLIAPMTANTVYDVSFWVSLSDTSQFAIDDGLEIYFSNAPVVGTGWASPNPITTITPQFQNNTTITDKINWVQISFEYTATGGEQYMTLGNFKTDLTTNLIPTSSGSKPYTYIYVDDFLIEASTCNPAWAPLTLCSTDSPVNLNNFVTGSPGGTWSGTGVNGNLFDPSAGTQNITYTLPCNADSTQTIVVTQNQGPIWTSTDTSICSGPLVLDAQNPGSIYTWQDNSSNQTYLATSAGQYSVQVEYGGCVVSDTFTINFNGPVVDLGPDITTCNPTITLDALNAGSTYLWQDNSTNQTFDATNYGTYYVEVSNGICTVSDTIIVSQGTITVSLPQDTLLCKGTVFNLDAQNPGANYNWSTDETSQVIPIDQAGIYWVEVTDNFCSGTDTITISFFQPEAKFSVSDTTGCAPLIANFTDLSTTPYGSIASWYWDFDDGQTSTIQHPGNEYASSGIYNVSLVVTTDSGCNSDTSKHVQIVIYPGPLAEFSIDQSTIQPGEQITFLDESIDALNWNWDFGDGYYSTSQNPTHSFENQGTYTIQLFVSNEACIDSAYLTIRVQEELVYYVPNAFTPDGDLFNNEFIPVFTSGVDLHDYHLTIFNRWGEIIFESYNPSIGWNGTYGHGGLVPDDVYTWKITVGDINNGKVHSINGHVSVLK